MFWTILLTRDRYWSDATQCQLVNGEFWSGRATNISAPPIPPVESRYFPWDAVFSHLNREKIATPFISTSNFMLWIVRLAAKEAARGVRNGRITIINAAMLDRCNVFHVPPFHRELCKKRPFENGAYYYHGSHEVFMISRIVRVRGVLRLISSWSTTTSHVKPSFAL